MAKRTYSGALDFIHTLRRKWIGDTGVYWVEQFVETAAANGAPRALLTDDWVGSLRSLFYAPLDDQATYIYIAPDIMEMLVAAANALTGSITLTEHDLPGMFGTVVFASPLQLVHQQSAPEGDGVVNVDVAAITWAWLGTHEGSNNIVAPTVQAATYRDGAGVQALVGTTNFQLRDQEVGPYTDHIFRLFYTLFIFMQQEIVRPETTPADRVTRRRLNREGHQHTDILVIKLRRSHNPNPSGGEHTEVEWSCQWVVRGHWRQQPYPTLGITRPKWIMPYTKGPEDRPLRNPEKIIALVR